MSKPYVISALRESDKKTIVANSSNRILAVVLVDCPIVKPNSNKSKDSKAKEAVTPENSAASSTDSLPANKNSLETPITENASAEPCYDLHLVQPPGQEAIDLAKQLLILIGTLMTSITSFYFATQATVAANKTSAAIITASKAGGSSTENASSNLHETKGNTNTE